MLMKKRRLYCGPLAPHRRSAKATFWQDNAGVAAAEAVLLALVFIGLSLMVGRILKPAIQTAARNLNQELAGGASH